MTFKWKFILIAATGWGVLVTLGVLGWQRWIDHQPLVLREAVVRLAISTIVGIGVGYTYWINAGRSTHRGSVL